MTEPLRNLPPPLQAFAQVVSYPKGKLLVESGQVCQHIFHLISGACRLVYYRQDREVTSWFAFENETITTSSFFSRQPGEECLQTLEPTTVIQLHYDQQQALLAAYPEAERYIRLQQEQLIIKLEDRIKSLLFQTAQERYNHLLESIPGIVQRVPQHMLAAYMGISPETLSRMRAVR